MAQPTVIIGRDAATRLKHGYPWVYEHELVDVQGARAGDAVRILGENGWSHGVGFFSDASPITVRRVDHRDVFLDHDFLAGRIGAAQQLRLDLLGTQPAYRLVNGEADGLPGLIIDRYDQTYVIQAHCQGSARLVDEVAEILRERAEPRQLIVRNDHPWAAGEGVEPRVEVLHGPAEGLVRFGEGKLRRSADALLGVGTGAFLDQQHNHLWVCTFAHGRALDLFCHGGGFALHLAGRCDSVTAVDHDPTALALAAEDAAANGLGNITFAHQDASRFLEAAKVQGEAFDTIVLDPPLEFTPEQLEALLPLAIRVAQVGAYLMAFTRRSPMQRDDFERQVQTAAAESGRRVQLLARRGPSWDHPTLMSLPQTEPLSGVLLRLV